MGAMLATLWSVRTGRDRLDSQTRAALIAAARITFSRLGYARTTVADITERADVSRATFYVYFASKDDVFRVLTQQLRDEFLEAQEAQGADPGDQVAVAAASVTRFGDVYARNLAFITVLEHQALTLERGRCRRDRRGQHGRDMAALVGRQRDGPRAGLT
jgi:AcrR family transcriptional regulator